MVAITFIQPDGVEKTIEATPGESLMTAATKGGVDGIAAECGGSCMCATCHCRVEAGPAGALPPVGDAERETLEFTAERMWEDSRLTCQVTATAELHGLTLRVVGR